MIIWLLENSIVVWESLERRTDIPGLPPTTCYCERSPHQLAFPLGRLLTWREGEFGTPGSDEGGLLAEGEGLAECGELGGDDDLAEGLAGVEVGECVFRVAEGEGLVDEWRQAVLGAQLHECLKLVPRSHRRTDH